MGVPRTEPAKVWHKVVPTFAVENGVLKGTQTRDKEIPAAVLDAAWEHLTFTVDPIASSLQTSAREATELGLLDDVDLDGIYDLTLLNELLDDDVEGLS